MFSLNKLWIPELQLVRYLALTLETEKNSEKVQYAISQTIM